MSFWCLSTSSSVSVWSEKWRACTVSKAFAAKDVFKICWGKSRFGLKVYALPRKIYSAWANSTSAKFFCFRNWADRENLFSVVQLLFETVDIPYGQMYLISNWQTFFIIIEYRNGYRTVTIIKMYPQDRKTNLPVWCFLFCFCWKFI